MAVTIKKRSYATKASKSPVPPALVGGNTPTERKKFLRIYEMPEENKMLLDGMFAEGKSITDIIFTLQDGWGMFKDISDNALRKYLNRYKWEVIDKSIAVRAELMKADSKVKILSDVIETFDVLKEVAELITVQKARVSKLYKREKDMPMLFGSMGGELKTLGGFVQQYAELSFDLGTLRRVPQVTKISKEGGITTVESEGKSHVIAEQESSHQMEVAAQAFMKVLEEFEVEKDHDIPSL